jgi:hypothetical protein
VCGYGSGEGHFQTFLWEAFGHQVNKERDQVAKLSVDSVGVSLCVHPTNQLALKFL